MITNVSTVSAPNSQSVGLDEISKLLLTRTIVFSEVNKLWVTLKEKENPPASRMVGTPAGCLEENDQININDLSFTLKVKWASLRWAPTLKQHAFCSPRSFCPVHFDTTHQISLAAARYLYLYLWLSVVAKDPNPTRFSEVKFKLFLTLKKLYSY